jgi:HD-GYP domain-containing protein (c-di-GMP phosphodiesterase class II)
MMCDSLDAMLSDRPYRKALSQDAVRAELDRCSGTQFDPEIVEAVIRGDLIAKAAALVPKLSPEEAAMAGF